jgi:hypothetical protein
MVRKRANVKSEICLIEQHACVERISSDGDCLTFRSCDQVPLGQGIGSIRLEDDSSTERSTRIEI